MLARGFFVPVLALDDIFITHEGTCHVCHYTLGLAVVVLLIKKVLWKLTMLLVHVIVRIGLHARASV